MNKERYTLILEYLEVGEVVKRRCFQSVRSSCHGGEFGRGGKE